MKPATGLDGKLRRRVWCYYNVGSSFFGWKLGSIKKQTSRFQTLERIFFYPICGWFWFGSHEILSRVILSHYFCITWPGNISIFLASKFPVISSCSHAILHFLVKSLISPAKIGPPQVDRCMAWQHLGWVSSQHHWHWAEVTGDMFFQLVGDIDVQELYRCHLLNIQFNKEVRIRDDGARE